MSLDRIEAIEKRRGYYVVRFLDASPLRVQAAIMRERRLSEGDELDAAQYALWLGERQKPLALEKAVALLALRARTEHELSSRLAAQGFAPLAVTHALQKLRARGLLNDADFARAYIREHGEREGARRLDGALRARGVASDTRERVLSERDEGDEQSAAELMARKLFKRFEGREDAARRVESALARRGFDWDTVRDAVRKAVSDE